MRHIDAITPIPKVTDRSYTVERVTKVGDGEHKVSRMIYTVTTYDRNGIVTTSTNSNKVDFLI